LKIPARIDHMKGTHHMTPRKIIKTVTNLVTATSAKIITRTNVRMNKKGNPYANMNVVKISTIVVELVPAYQDAVNEQRDTENKPTDFQASERRWGQNTGTAGLVEHGGKQYLSFIAKKHILTTYMAGDKIISKDDIAPYLPKKKEGTNQGLDAPVIFRSVEVKNILAMNII